MTRTELTRRWATVATVAIVIVGIVALLNWEFTSGVITAYETFFKLIGYIVAPSLAYLGFIYGRLDKAELVDLAEQRTKAKLKADAAEKGARRAQNEAEVQRGMAEAAHEAAAVAGDRAEQQAKLAQVATADAEAKTERIAELEDDFSKLSDATQFWKLGNKSRKIRGFAEFDDWKHDPVGARIVTIGLFKGGVGKTHLAGNFAAYVSEKQQKPVLLIDLDFQGSLSSLVMGAGGIDKRDELGKDTSPIDALFDESADSGTVERRRVFLGDIGG